MFPALGRFGRLGRLGCSAQAVPPADKRLQQRPKRPAANESCQSLDPSWDEPEVESLLGRCCSVADEVAGQGASDALQRLKRLKVGIMATFLRVRVRVIYRAIGRFGRS